MKTNVELSVCYVTYQATQYLRESLDSLFKNTHLDLEIVVVDNGSSDGVQEMLLREYPSVQFFRNSKNLGFTFPMNQALRQAKGDFLLLLNPDTVILPNALETLLSFMLNHVEVGICGPKVLNIDGTLQKPCRRGDARPWAVITYFTGLSALFPRSKLFSQYLMGYKEPDQAHLVDGVSGSCMLIRRKVIDEIGYLDERFFAYQEDADYCLRARQAGWQVFYVPDAQIIHYGGRGGSHVNPIQSIYAWHKAYFLLFRKHFAGDYFFLFNWLYYLAMIFKLLLSLLVNLLHISNLFHHPRADIFQQR